MENLRRVPSLLGSFLLMAVLASPAAGQYFGQNKVQYDDFDWKVIATEHLDVHFYTETMAESREMARAAERWQWRLSRVFDHRLTERKPVVLYANHPDFQQTHVIQSEIGVGTGGVTDPVRNRATQPFTGDFHGTAHVVGHELVHVFQFDIAEAGPGTRAMARLPLWLIEGTAEYLSVGRVDPHTAMWLRDAVLRGEVPTISQLTAGRFFPYRYGQALMAYIGGRWGDAAVTRLYKVALTEGLNRAIIEVTGLTSEQLSDAWARDLREAYLPLVQDRDAPQYVGRELLADTRRRGRMNLAPVLSPDGSRLAFLSERGLFSIDLYVADVETGEIVSRLTSSNREPHFDALNFLESAGTWSPDGRYFAYVVVDQGDHQLRIADVESGRRVRSLKVAEAPALNDPAWSPDGRRLAFAGSSKGIHDLFVYDLDSDEVIRLTDDMHAELQPSWSPDGSTLVFVTDRGPETDLTTLDFGPFRLATIDVASRQIELLPSFPDAKHIDPHFAPDGRSVYFISDREGVSDIYRLELATESFFQVTRTATGISGITAEAPALSVAANTGRVAFSIFQDDRYTIHALEPGEAQGAAVAASGGRSPGGVLPPVAYAGAPGQDVVSTYLASPTTGLPMGDDYAVTDYRPTLGLDYVGPPMLGVAVDQFGTNIGGAVSVAFRDLLGGRTVGVMAQAQGELEDLGAQVFYENRENRINWGVMGGRVPYRSGRRFVEPIQGTSLVQVRNQVFRTNLNQVGGKLAYPFSRYRRVETNASYTLFTFSAKEEIFRCTPTGQDCQQVAEEPLEPLVSEPINLGRVGAALVGDWANFGFTGPVAGGRYRFELEPNFGDLQYATALADYRRYLFRRPFTLAVRGLHYGRYGEDAENRRFMSPLFLGYGGLVRGYTMSSFSTAECSGLRGGSGCPEFDRLIGSRIALANLEVRVPLLGTPDFGIFDFPMLPTTVGAFVDAGAAWTGDESPRLEFATNTSARVPVASTGVFARTNVLGYVVVSTWLAHPFQRPQKDWVFGLELSPGW